jgi:hypothetical protein
MAEKQDKPQAPPLLLAELLFEEKPSIDRDAIAARISSRLPNTRLVSSPDKSDMLLFAHEDHVFTYKGGEQVPGQFVVMQIDDPLKPERIESALHQTWDWPEAKQLAPRFRWQITAVEMMSQPLGHRARVTLFQSALLGLVEATSPLAIHCHHCERIVNPANLRRASGAEDPLAMFMQAINVRLFRITGDAEKTKDMLMDTRGLAALFLPDLQLHFRGLDPGRVAGHLYNCARYLYEQGDIIKDGETIAGLSASDRWKCQHENALLAPERIVLDLNPGAPYAAGKRSA